MQELISVGTGAAESMALILLGLAAARWVRWNRDFPEHPGRWHDNSVPKVVHTEGREELAWRAEPEEHPAAHGKGRPALPRPAQQSKRYTIST